ncbi:hypothetical protein BURMUCF1_A0933 [Burkholderia multivorans ATCC BAA-247]|nr:hypothetical protein BURMUCF1_A0933 [Burkholderia multivorans ATCC BAA-247]
MRSIGIPRVCTGQDADRDRRRARHGGKDETLRTAGSNGRLLDDRSNQRL